MGFAPKTPLTLFALMQKSKQQHLTRPSDTLSNKRGEAE